MSRPPASGPDGVRRVVVLDRRQRRTARERAQAVAVEIGQDRVEPAPDIAAVKQMLGAQRAHQRVLHQIVGRLGVARQRARVAAQRRDRRLNALAKTAHDHFPCESSAVATAARPPAAVRGTAPSPRKHRRVAAIFPDSAGFVAPIRRRACGENSRSARLCPLLAGPMALCHTDAAAPSEARRAEDTSCRTPVSCAESAA